MVKAKNRPRTSVLVCRGCQPTRRGEAMTEKEVGISCGQTWSLSATRQQLDRFFAYLADMDKICGGVLKSQPDPSLGRGSGLVATILNIGTETAGERRA